MTGITIFLFGGMRVVDTVSGGEVRFPTRKSRSLLAYLVLRKRPVPRLMLADQFWPESDEDHGRRALNTEFWRVRQSLKAVGCQPDEYLRSDGDTLGFRDESRHWSDTMAFDSAMSTLDRARTQMSDESSFAALVDAVLLYRGDLMDGFPDEFWLIERERYRSRVAAALEFLHDCFVERQRWPEAIGCARQLLSIDPFLEHVHRSLMRCYDLIGNRPAALKQYARLADLLQKELQVRPMDETRRLHDAILGVSTASRSGSAAPDPLMFRNWPATVPKASVGLKVRRTTTEAGR